jgi:hypothetical protein
MIYSFCGKNIMFYAPPRQAHHSEHAHAVLDTPTSCIRTSCTPMPSTVYFTKHIKGMPTAAVVRVHMLVFHGFTSVCQYNY